MKYILRKAKELNISVDEMIVKAAKDFVEEKKEKERLKSKIK